MIDPANPLPVSREEPLRPVERSVVDGVLVLTVRDAAFGGSAASALFNAVASWGAARQHALTAVVDLTGTTFDPSGQELRAGAQRIKGLGLKGKVALQVEGDFQYGLGRMLGILTEDSGVSIRPFKSRDEAEDWLGNPEPDLDPF